MADNYIEKQYELYQARKAAWEKAKKLGKIKSKTISKPKETSHSTQASTCDSHPSANS